MTGQPAAARAGALTLAAALAALAPAPDARAATMVEVHQETRATHIDCRAAWSRLKSAYRRKATEACKDAGGIENVAEPETGRKPVGEKFICTVKGRISCRK